MYEVGAIAWCDAAQFTIEPEKGRRIERGHAQGLGQIDTSADNRTDDSDAFENSLEDGEFHLVVGGQPDKDQATVPAERTEGLLTRLRRGGQDDRGEQ